MDLSAKMPASQDAQQEARMPATRESDAPPFAGEGGSMEPRTTPIKTQSAYSGDCEARDKGTQGWEAQDRKDSTGWETADRKN